MVDYSLDGKVVTSSEEAWSQDKTAHLHLEAIRGPGVLVHHETPAIANRFKTASYRYDDSERANFSLPSYNQLGEEADGEQNQEEDIAAQVWVVPVSCPLDGAFGGDLRAETARHGVRRFGFGDLQTSHLPVLGRSHST